MESQAIHAELFHWADYVTFALSIVVSLTVGIFYGFFKKTQTTTKEFLLANQSMHVFPVSISFFLSWYSAIAFLGEPVEVYYYGGIYLFIGIGYLVGLVPVAIYFAPMFHKLQLVSCFEVSQPNSIIYYHSDKNF